MSYVIQYRMDAYEKAFWYFSNEDYTTPECEFYAKEFEKYALENISDGVTLQDLLTDFVADVRYSENAERDKERSRYA